MRRTATTISKLISLSKITPSSSPITHNLTSQISKNPPKSNNSSKTHNFPKYPCHNFSTQVQIPPKTPSKHGNFKERSKLEEEFDAAKTPEDMLAAFEEMEEIFDEKDLGLACLKMGLKMDQVGEEPEKILSFASRALAIFDANDENKCSLPIAMALQLLGSTNYSMNKFSEALGFLNRANKILGKLENEEKYSVDDIKPILHAVHLELANVKVAMGRREEALENLRVSLEIKTLLLGEDDREVGNANRDYAEACVAILNFKEALPYCLKALEVHISVLGKNSVEVAHDRRLLGVIYTGMEKHEKALEENKLARKVLKSWGRSSDLLRAEIDAANMNIALEKYDVAVDLLKGVVQQTEKDSENRGLIFITMGKAFVGQDKFADAKRCLEVASGILSKKENSKPLEVSEAYMEISMQYENMNELEIAINLLKKAHSLLEKSPQEQHAEGSVSARIGWLLLLSGKVTEAIPYLENAAETLKESFGAKHFGVGYVYNNLGAAYLELERPQSAAQMFDVAKQIMDTSLGPHHVDSIEACQNLSKAYAAMRSFGLAIEFQERAVAAWRGHGSNAEDQLREALEVLDQLQMNALADAINDMPTIPTKALPLPHSTDAKRGRQPDQSAELRQSDLVSDQLQMNALSDATNDISTKALPLPHNTDAKRGLQPDQSGEPRQSGAV